VGLVGLEKAPVREGTEITNVDGHCIGKVTSGTVGPTYGQPIAMAWISTEYATPEQIVYAQVRGKALPMRINAMPFVPHRYFR
jgi:aminomethyltransferase